MALEIIFAIVIFIGILSFVIGGKRKKKWKETYKRYDDHNDIMHPANPAGPVYKFIHDNMYPEDKK